MFAGKKSAQIREILISESAWEEMTCLFAPSLAQYREMRESGVRLVVPSSLHKKYPEAVRAELMTLGAFIAELTELYADIP